MVRATWDLKWRGEQMSRQRGEATDREATAARPGPQTEAGPAADRPGHTAALGNQQMLRLLGNGSGPVVPSLAGVLGNRAVRRLLRDASGGQSAGPDLPVTAPDSPVELQATELARSTDPGALADAGLAAAAPPPGASPVGGSGSPVPPPLRREYEQTLGADLSGVRIHNDAASHAFAAEVGAKAATVGSHVYFAEGRFAPETATGQEILRHELVHTLQPQTGTALMRTPADEARLAEIEQQLASSVITDEYRAQITQERAALLGRGNSPGAGQPITVISMTEAEYQALTGQPAAALPEDALPPGPGLDLEPGAAGPAPGAVSAIPGGLGAGSLSVPQPNWYYRVLSPTDPSAAQILGGADLLPVPLAPGNTFQPAANPAEMTFRHLRPGGNVPQVGTDRISTAGDLEAFRTILADRGTGELVRVDVDAARRLGAQFLEQGDVLAHLDEIGRTLTEQLEAARAAGRGRNYIARLEGRMRALEAARNYARTFQEGQGVNSIPSRAVSQVEGASLPEAVAGEQAFARNLRFFRYGGRVLLVVGAGMSMYRVASAPPEQQGRVAAQEAGGWALSLPAGAAGAEAGAALGGALGIETGPGAIVLAAFGALVGGAIGFFGGQEAADELYNVGEDFSRGMRQLSNPATLIETETLMFGSPEDRRRYYEMRELETGEPSPFDLP